MIIEALAVIVAASVLFVLAPTVPALAARNVPAAENIGAAADQLGPDEAASNAAELAAAQKLPPDEYSLGTVDKVSDSAQQEVAGAAENTKTYKVKLTNGKDKGAEVTISDVDLDAATAGHGIKAGETVVVMKSYQISGPPIYYIVDEYRIPPLIYIAIIFFAAAAIFGKKRGLTSVLGLVTTVAVIVFYVIPRLVAGGQPLTVCLIAAVLIATSSLYLAHGFNTRTSIALVSTLVTLAFSAWMAVKFVAWAKLMGMGSEDALFLQTSGFNGIDLRGLLLGGIMLGVLGILDDITTAQAAIVDELKHANPKLKFAELYRRALSVGREHIASLINTLFLAYAGAALPLFLLFSASKGQPFWFVVNSETIAEEIVRTLVGSICLILAVPITTTFAAAFYSEYQVKIGDAPPEAHHHH